MQQKNVKSSFAAFVRVKSPALEKIKSVNRGKKLTRWLVLSGPASRSPNLTERD